MSDNICKFYAKGECSHGADCRFSHGGMVDSAAGVPKSNGRGLTPASVKNGNRGAGRGAAKAPSSGPKPAAAAGGRGAGSAASSTPAQGVSARPAVWGSNGSGVPSSIIAPTAGRADNVAPPDTFASKLRQFANTAEIGGGGGALAPTRVASAPPPAQQGQQGQQRTPINLPFKTALQYGAGSGAAQETTTATSAIDEAPGAVSEQSSPSLSSANTASKSQQQQQQKPSQSATSSSSASDAAASNPNVAPTAAGNGGSENSKGAKLNPTGKGAPTWASLAAKGIVPTPPSVSTSTQPPSPPRPTNSTSSAAPSVAASTASNSSVQGLQGQNKRGGKPNGIGADSSQSTDSASASSSSAPPSSAATVPPSPILTTAPTAGSSSTVTGGAELRAGGGKGGGGKGAAKSAEVCRFWERFECLNGAECKWVHQGPGGGGGKAGDPSGSRKPAGSWGKGGKGGGKGGGVMGGGGVRSKDAGGGVSGEVGKGRVEQNGDSKRDHPQTSLKAEEGAGASSLQPPVPPQAMYAAGQPPQPPVMAGAYPYPQPVAVGGGVSVAVPTAAASGYYNPAAAAAAAGAAYMQSPQPVPVWANGNSGSSPRGQQQQGPGNNNGAGLSVQQQQQQMMMHQQQMYYMQQQQMMAMRQQQQMQQQQMQGGGGGVANVVPAAAAAAAAAAAGGAGQHQQHQHGLGGGGGGGSNEREQPLIVPNYDNNFIFSVDVECVATGPQHHDRAVAQIGMVDCYGRMVLNLLVKPVKAVVSYLTPLTGLTAESLDKFGQPEPDAIANLKRCLPPTAILVGMNIRKDIEWLGLVEGVDFAACIDLSDLFRVWNEERRSFTYFGLDHTAKVWLSVPRDQPGGHDAVTDAFHSMSLFNKYRTVQHSPAELKKLQQETLKTPITPSFAKQFPTFEGCCMGNRKACTCGAPFYG